MTGTIYSVSASDTASANDSPASNAIYSVDINEHACAFGGGGGLTAPFIANTNALMNR